MGAAKARTRSHMSSCQTLSRKVDALCEAVQVPIDFSVPSPAAETEIKKINELVNMGSLVLHKVCGPCEPSA